MKLRELFEKIQDEVAIIFGRFNPPHKGHRAAWEIMKKYPNWYVGTNADTQGPKDPLPFDVKVEAMKTIYPELKGHLMSEQSWLTMASKVYEQNPDARLLVFTDEDWVTKTIQQYNGVEGKNHGFYNFSSIEQKPTPRLSSATDLRDAVKAGDKDAFTKAAGVSADTEIMGKPFFDLVAEYLLPYAEKEKAKAAKKKKTEEIEEGWKQNVAAAALAAANLLGTPAQAAEKSENPITIAYVMIDGETKKYNLGDKFSSAQEAEKFVSGILQKKGLSGYTIDIKRGYPKKSEKEKDYLDKTPYSVEPNGSKDYLEKEPYTPKRMTGNYLTQGKISEANYGRYWCSTDKKWKTRKGPKQKRSS